MDYVYFVYGLVNYVKVVENGEITFNAESIEKSESHLKGVFATLEKAQQTIDKMFLDFVGPFNISVYSMVKHSEELSYMQFDITHDDGSIDNFIYAIFKREVIK